MKRFTKILILVLALATILGAFTVVAFAEEETPLKSVSVEYSSFEAKETGDVISATNRPGLAYTYVSPSTSNDGTGNKYVIITPTPAKGESAGANLDSSTTFLATEKITEGNVTSVKPVYNVADYPYMVFDFDVMTPTGLFQTDPTISWRMKYTARNADGSLIASASLTDSKNYPIGIKYKTFTDLLDNTPYKWQHVTIIMKPLYTLDENGFIETIDCEYKIYVDGDTEGEISGTGTAMSSSALDKLKGIKPEEAGHEHVRMSLNDSTGTKDALAGVEGFVATDPSTWPAAPFDWYKDQTAFDNISYHLYEKNASYDAIAAELYSQKTDIPEQVELAAVLKRGDAVVGYYATVEAAIEAAQDGDVITIYKDIEDPVSVNKAITIDTRQSFKFVKGMKTDKNVFVTDAQGNVLVPDNTTVYSGSYTILPYAADGFVLSSTADRQYVFAAADANTVKITWDPVCQDPSSCANHDHKNVITPVATGVDYTIYKDYFASQDIINTAEGKYVTFKHFSLTPGGEAYDFAQAAESDITLHAVYDVDGLFELKKSDSSVSYYPAGDLAAIFADAATSYKGSTIKLYSDITITESLKLQGSMNLTLDLNGKKLTVALVNNVTPTANDNNTAVFYSGTNSGGVSNPTLKVISSAAGGAIYTKDVTKNTEDAQGNVTTTSAGCLLITGKDNYFIGANISFSDIDIYAAGILQSGQWGSIQYDMSFDRCNFYQTKDTIFVNAASQSSTYLTFKDSFIYSIATGTFIKFDTSNENTAINEVTFDNTVILAKGSIYVDTKEANKPTIVFKNGCYVDGLKISNSHVNVTIEKNTVYNGLDSYVTFGNNCDVLNISEEETYTYYTLIDNEGVLTPNDETYQVTFTKKCVDLDEYPKYTINWICKDGCKLNHDHISHTTQLFEGKTPVFDGIIPWYDVVNNKVIRFVGWDVEGDGIADELPVLGKILEDTTITYYAVFEEIDGVIAEYIAPNGNREYAQDGEQFVALFNKAAAAGAATTIKLYGDVLVKGNLYLANNMNVTIDLQGHTLSVTPTVHYTYTWNEENKIYDVTTVGSRYVFFGNTVTGNEYGSGVIKSPTLVITSSVNGGKLISDYIYATETYVGGERDGEVIAEFKDYSRSSTLFGGTTRYFENANFTLTDVEIRAASIINTGWGGTTHKITLDGCEFYQTAGASTFFWAASNKEKALYVKDSLIYSTTSSFIGWCVNNSISAGTSVVFENSRIIANGNIRVVLDPGRTGVENLHIIFKDCLVSGVTVSENNECTIILDQGTKLDTNLLLSGAKEEADAYLYKAILNAANASYTVYEWVLNELTGEYELIEKTIDVTYYYFVTNYDDAHATVTWKDSEGNVLGSAEVLKNTLPNHPNVGEAGTVVGDDYRVVINKIHYWIDQNGVILNAIGEDEEYVLVPIDPDDSLGLEEVEYKASIRNAKFNLIYYQNFTIALYLPVASDMLAPEVSGGFELQDNTVFINAKEYWVYYKVFSTTETADQQITITFVRDGKSYEATTTIGILTYAEKLINNSDNEEEKNAIRNMVRFIDECYKYDTDNRTDDVKAQFAAIISELGAYADTTDNQDMSGLEGTGVQVSFKILNGSIAYYFTGVNGDITVTYKDGGKVMPLKNVGDGIWESDSVKIYDLIKPIKIQIGNAIGYYSIGEYIEANDLPIGKAILAFGTAAAQYKAGLVSDTYTIDLLDGETPKFRFVLSGTLSEDVVNAIKALGYDYVADTVATRDDGSELIEVLVGDVLTRGYEYRFDRYSLGADGFIIKRVEDKLIITGGSDEAIVDAIAAFNEKVLGENEGEFKSNIRIYRRGTMNDVTLFGEDIRGYSIAVDKRSEKYYEAAKALQQLIYTNTGYRLTIVPLSCAGKSIVISADAKVASGEGYYVTFDEGLITINCEFELDVVDATIEVFSEIFTGEGAVALNDALDTSVNVRDIFYEDFGEFVGGATREEAKANAETTIEAIRACHDLANKYGYKVHAKDGWYYYIGKLEKAITIKTDVDFGTANFIIDDSAFTPLEVSPDGVTYRTVQIFTVPRVGDVVSFDANSDVIVDLNAAGGIDKDTIEKLDLGLGYPALVYVANKEQKQYVREGVNENAGTAQYEYVLIDAEGNIDPTTPFMFDFAKVTNITARPIDAAPLTIEGGIFTTIANIGIEEGNEGYKEYLSYARGFSINRSNVTVKDMEHYIEGEGALGHPYGGFHSVNKANNVLFENCVYTGHKTYDGTNGAGMGTYDISPGESTNITWKNCTQSNFFDSNVWGVMGSSYCKNVTFDGCVLNRFDAHCGILNATVKDSVIKHIRITGGGTFTLENSVVFNSTVVALREDYGAFWHGDIVLDNVSVVSTSTVSLVSASYWVNWDFGYPTALPTNITVNNLQVYESYNIETGVGVKAATPPTVDVFNSKFVTDYSSEILEDSFEVDVKDEEGNVTGTETVPNINPMTPTQKVTITNNNQGLTINTPDGEDYPFFADLVVERD